MTRTIFFKAVRAGKVTVLAVGLAVVLALVLGTATAALAGTGVGATFNLGQTNLVNAVSKLAGNAAGPMLQINNASTDARATGITLRVQDGRAPLKVSNPNAG